MLKLNYWMKDYLCKFKHPLVLYSHFSALWPTLHVIKIPHTKPLKLLQMYHKAFKCITVKVRKCPVGKRLHTKAASKCARRQSSPRSGSRLREQTECLESRQSAQHKGKWGGRVNRPRWGIIKLEAHYLTLRVCSVLCPLCYVSLPLWF